MTATPAARPLRLTTADAHSEQVLEVRFSPEDDGTHNAVRLSALRLTSTDPQARQFDIQLLGSASEPLIYGYPPYCRFSDPVSFGKR